MRQQLAEQLDAAWGDGVLRRSTRATLRSRLPPLAVAGAPPTVLRGFVRQETLAETESSVVELAYDVALGREVVLKRLRLPSDADGGARLQREARVAGRLEHVGVLPVHGLLATTEVGPVVVLSHLRGSTWELAIERGGRSLRDHVEIAVAVARALAHAHADGVLHLDVKPANVLLGGYGEVCLTGWGEGGEDGVLPTVPVGTPAYAPLEVVRGAPCAQSDVYLLAGCLWHAATGRPPHDRTDVVAALLASGEAPEPPAALPGTLGALLARALSPVLAERPASVEAFATELQEFLRSLDSQRVTDDVRESLGPNARISALEESVQQLEAALSLWPSNLEARDLLADIRATLVHRFVQSGDLASAERVAGGADALPLAVRGDIERLRRERRAEATAPPHAEHPPAARDRLVALWGLVFLANIALVLAVPSPSPQLMLALAAVPTALLAVVVGLSDAWKRKPAYAALALAVLTAWSVDRAVGAWMAVEPDILRIGELVTAASLMLAAGGFHRPFTYLAFGGYGAAAVAAVYPSASRVLLIAFVHIAPLVAVKRR